MRIAVTGGDGQLGWALRSHPLARRHEWIAFDRQTCDLAQPQQTVAALLAARPEVVINCAAYTRVDQAEQEAETCRAVNVGGVKAVVEACNRGGAQLVQISSDYVFGGDLARCRPYREADPPAPQSVYGRSKREGEQAAMRARRWLVVRSCGLYGIRGPLAQRSNFVNTLLRLGTTRASVQVVDDQICCPTFVEHLAAAILRLLEADAHGIVHAVNGSGVTWRRFAEEIYKRSQMPVEVEPITTAQFAAAAARPRYSVLDCTRYRELTGFALPEWQEALRECLQPDSPE